MRCDFRLIEGTASDYKCRLCGRTIPNVSMPLVANCRVAVDAKEAPQNWRKALNFAKAVFNQLPLTAEACMAWDRTKAFRSQPEIEAIASICKACPLFNGEICTHRDCGCAIDEGRAAWWSKIAWKSQKCPDEPPQWT